MAGVGHEDANKTTESLLYIPAPPIYLFLDLTPAPPQEEACSSRLPRAPSVAQGGLSDSLKLSEQYVCGERDKC